MDRPAPAQAAEWSRGPQHRLTSARIGDVEISWFIPPKGTMRVCSTPVPQQNSTSSLRPCCSGLAERDNHGVAREACRLTIVPLRVEFSQLGVRTWDACPNYASRSAPDSA